MANDAAVVSHCAEVADGGNGRMVSGSEGDDDDEDSGKGSNGEGGMISGSKGDDDDHNDTVQHLVCGRVLSFFVDGDDNHGDNDGNDGDDDDHGDDRDDDDNQLNTVLRAWSKSNSQDKASRARKLLEKMYDRADIISYNILLNAAAFTSGSGEATQKALCIATKTFTEIKASSHLKPDEVTYGTVLKAFARFMMPGEEKIES